MYADLRDVTAVLAGAARTLDLGRPVALTMLGVLGHVDDHGAARSITSQLMDALPAGSGPQGPEYAGNRR